MQLNIPYLASPGSVVKALERIKEIPTPEKVSQDFIKTKVGIKGGTGNSVNSFLKKIGFVSEDGSPTSIYKKFRNPKESKKAMATAIKHGYSDLYSYNEYLHELTDQEIKGLLIEHGGYKDDARPIFLIISTLNKLKDLADFEKEDNFDIQKANEKSVNIEKESSIDNKPVFKQSNQDLGMNISYTINLNLPATNDISIYNSIFKSLKENLLRND